MTTFQAHIDNSMLRGDRQAGEALSTRRLRYFTAGMSTAIRSSRFQHILYLAFRELREHVRQHNTDFGGFTSEDRAQLDEAIAVITGHTSSTSSDHRVTSITIYEPSATV